MNDNTPATTKHLMALLGIFPTPQSFLDFKKDDESVSKQAIPEFIHYAKTNSLILSEDENEFIEFIDKNTQDADERRIPSGFSFEDLIDEVTEDSSVNNLIAELNVIAKQFNMAKVQGSMFSRLKRDFNLNTPAKRNCIRILSFWLGENKPLLGWSYQRIAQIPRLKEQDLAIEEQEGVRIAFRLEGRGEIIDTDTVKWLQGELAKCITDLKLYHIDLEKVTCFATTVFLNIPKNEGPAGEPRLYDEAVRDSMFIAHQLLNRFYLSDHSSQQKALIVAIDAGKFTNLDTSLQVLLEVELPEDPVIRLSSFVRLCSRLADNRVIFSRTPKELKTVNGNILTVWYVDCFWTFYYYDFIPRLLEEDMLPTTQKAHMKFVTALFNPHGRNNIPLKALSAIHKFPKNDLLILEVAKVCVARRMLRAANMVLSTILVSNPHHLVAKTFRMSIFMYLAMEQTDVTLFDLFHQRAIDEGLSIIENCFIEDEEFYCEFGLVYFLAALRIFSILKENKGNVKNGNVNIQRVFSLLDAGEKLFRKGAIYAPPGIGNRCNFLQIHIYCFKKLLEGDSSLYTTPKPLTDIHNIYETAGNEFIAFLGWTDLPFSESTLSQKPGDDIAAKLVNLFLKQILALFHQYEGSVLFRITFPSTQFTYASMVFDFSPFITVRLLKMVISWLEQARIEAEKLKKDTIGVYALLNCYGRIQSPEQYVTLIDKAVNFIKEKAKEDLEKTDDHLINKDIFEGFKLILLSLDEKVRQGILIDESSVDYARSA